LKRAGLGKTSEEDMRLDKLWKTIRYPIDKEYWVKEIREGKNFQWEVDLNNYANADSNIWHTDVTQIYLDAIAQYKVPFSKKMHCRLFFVKIMAEDFYAKYPVLGQTGIIWNITGINKESRHKIVGSNNEGSVALEVKTAKPLLVDMNSLKTITDVQRRDLVLIFDEPFDKVLESWDEYNKL